MRTPRSHPALESSPSQGTLEDVRMPVRAKLAAAWTSVMFLYIYVDYFQLFKPGYVADLLAGSVAQFDISQTFVVIGVTSVAIPSLMILLSTTLPARVNRTVNLVVATLFIAPTIYNADGESWSYSYFYGLSIGLELLLLAFILRSAWTWPRRTASPATLTASLDSEPLRTPQQA